MFTDIRQEGCEKKLQKVCVGLLKMYWSLSLVASLFSIFRTRPSRCSLVLFLFLQHFATLGIFCCTVVDVLVPLSRSLVEVY